MVVLEVVERWNFHAFLFKNKKTPSKHLARTMLDLCTSEHTFIKLLWQRLKLFLYIFLMGSENSNSKLLKWNVEVSNRQRLKKRKKKKRQKAQAKVHKDSNKWFFQSGDLLIFFATVKSVFFKFRLIFW